MPGLVERITNAVRMACFVVTSHNAKRVIGYVFHPIILGIIRRNAFGAKYVGIRIGSTFTTNLFTVPCTRAMAPTSKTWIQTIWKYVYGTVVRRIRVAETCTLAFWKPVVLALFAAPTFEKPNGRFICRRRYGTGVADARSIRIITLPMTRARVKRVTIATRTGPSVHTFTGNTI